MRGYTKFDFTVDEGKGCLNPSREKTLRQALQKEDGEINHVWLSSCVTLAGASTSLTSRINGMATRTHTHKVY